MSQKDDTLAPVPPSEMMIRLSPLAGWMMAIFLMAGLVSSLWAIFVTHKINFPPKKLEWESIWSGELTHQLAKELGKVPIAQEAADLERAASWLTMGDTGSRVRQGCQGWLFLAAELIIHPHAQENAKARAAKVIAVRDWLAARNIRLLVTIVPDKSRIASDQLCALERAASLASRIEDWQSLIESKGIPTVNLTNVLSPLGGSAFLRTDSHWTELGAETSARALATRFRELGGLATPHQQLERHAGIANVRPGDLVRLAGLDWLPLALQPDFEKISTTSFSSSSEVETSSSASLESLFGDAQLPNVALIGTSFSRNSNFVPFLEEALGARLGNFAKDGGEFSGAAKEYLAGFAFKQTPPQWLIWEICERDLQSPWQDDLPLP